MIDVLQFSLFLKFSEQAITKFKLIIWEKNEVKWFPKPANKFLIVCHLPHEALSIIWDITRKKRIEYLNNEPQECIIINRVTDAIYLLQVL